MKKYILPDFQHSNLNISATLAEFLGSPNKNATLPVIKEYLDKNYKNVVFICFDGLGIYPLSQNLRPDDFLRKNKKETLLSTFPSTTTNATRSLLTNHLPAEHGWLGWSMYFEEINRNVDIFLDCDSLTEEPVVYECSPLEKSDYYFDQSNSEYSVNTVFPGYVGVVHPERNHVFKEMDDFFNILGDICLKPGKQFVYAYYPDPDMTMHAYGVTSPESKTIIEAISDEVEKLYDKAEDTLFIISADHGQVDIEGYVNLYEDEKLMDMLKIYPFLEARAPSFLVKNGREKEFEQYFQMKYGTDFELYKSEDLISKGYFGTRGDKTALLGTYTAIGTYTHKQALLHPNSTKYKGHHTSLTEEMEVPLILLSKKSVAPA